jgi:hypothetical protein
VKSCASFFQTFRKSTFVSFPNAIKMTPIQSKFTPKRRFFD